MLLHIMCGANTAITNVGGNDVQPNAIDLRVAKVFKIRPADFVLSETEKVHRGTDEQKPLPDGFWCLEPGSYEVVMENIVSVGQGEAGFVVPRSTLNRNGVFITSGLYDTGYNGAMAACIHVTSGRFWLKPGTRVAQYLIFASQQVGNYNGSYGLNKAHDEKYKL